MSPKNANQMTRADYERLAAELDVIRDGKLRENGTRIHESWPYYVMCAAHDKPLPDLFIPSSEGTMTGYEGQDSPRQRQRQEELLRHVDEIAA